jgi:predicted alpha/beta superfamily hydrolase
MKFKLFLLLFTSTTLLFSQRISESIESKKLNAPRNFEVVLPASYESDLEKKYPVLVVLDGEYLLNPFEGNLKYGNYWDDLPEMIIISIFQNYGETRYNDSAFDPAGIPAGSGADFFEFIGMELLPYVEKKYRTQPFRIIAGHDTTAGFLNSYLYKEDPVFNAYISISPDMPIEMEKRVPERLTAISKSIFYYQAIAEKDDDITKNKVKTLDLNIKINPNFKYHFDEIKGTTHYSLVGQAIPSALYFIFDGYQPISMLEFKSKIATLDKGYTQYLIDKYTYLSERLSLDIKPRLSDFKAIEAAILKNKAYPELQELSKYAEKHYPKTTLSVYHEAMYYEKMGEFKKAVKEYRKAFSREELKEVRELTKDYMLTRAEDLKKKEDESKVEEYVEEPTEEGDKKENSDKKEGGE